MKVLESSTAISFQNILFLTDLTEASQAAFTYARAFARHYGATIFPAHVVVPFMATELEAPVVPDIIKQLATLKREELTQLFKGSGLPYEPLVSDGMIERVVPGWLDKHGIDLIVIGTHGRKGMDRFLLGSTAETIFRTAPCPVLTVGPNVTPQAAGVEPDIKKILFATDLSESSKLAASYAFSFAHEKHAHLTLLHVLPEKARNQPDGGKLLASVIQELKDLVPSKAELWCEPEICVEEGDATEAILNYAEREKPDLIVLGLPKTKQFSTHYRRGVTYKVVSASPSPVLTIRDSM